MHRSIGQDQLDRLFSAALESAIARVERDGSFFPLLFEIRRGGEIQAVAVLEKQGTGDTQSAIARLDRVLQQRAADGAILASAIAVYGPERLTVRLRARRYSADVDAPYSLETVGLLKRRRTLKLAGITSWPAPNDVFAIRS